MEPSINSEIPLVNQNYLLKKYSGKGGWTFAVIPEIPKDQHAWFGWVKVRGSIDGYEIKNYHLMSMSNGMMFLPVKAEIRKKIGKNEGAGSSVVSPAGLLGGAITFGWYRVRPGSPPLGVFGPRWTRTAAATGAGQSSWRPS